MPRTRSYNVAIDHFRYAEFERALAHMLGAGGKTLGALRGRLKRLATLGIPGTGPGKGSRRLYTWEEAVMMALALLLEDAGLDPVVVASALKNTWPRLASAAMAAAEASDDNPAMLMIRIEAIAGPWKTGDPLAGMPWISIMKRIDERSQARRVTMYREHFAKLGRDEPAVQALIEKLARYEADNTVMMVDRDEPGWLPIRPLTDRLKVLKTALHRGSHGRP